MEAKVSAAISEQLDTISSEIEAQRSRIERKRLLVDRVFHNWNCLPSPVASSGVAEEMSEGQPIIREPVMVPLDSPSPVVSLHRLRMPESVPENCQAPVRCVRILHRIYRGQWVIAVEVEPSERGPVLTHLLPVSESEWEDALSWRTPAVQDGETACFLACCPLPEFSSKSSLRVHLFLTHHDVLLPIGDTHLTWEDLMYARVPYIPESPDEMESLDEKEKSLVTAILDSLQVCTRISVTLESPLRLMTELESELGVSQLSKKKATWVRRPVGLIGCRMTATQSDGAGDLLFHLWTYDQQQTSLFIRWLKSKIPEEAVSASPSASTPVESFKSLHARFMGEVDSLFSLYRREVDALIEEMGGPRLTEDNTSSPTKMATLLSELKETQKMAPQKLPRTVRDRLRSEAKAIREKFADLE